MVPAHMTEAPSPLHAIPAHGVGWSALLFCWTEESVWFGFFTWLISGEMGGIVSAEQC